MDGWRDLVADDLRRRFPRSQFTFVDAGIPSLGSVPHSFRLERDVLAGGPIDLLFLEAAVNDEANGTSTTDQLRAMEGIVRHVRRTFPETDIVMLQFADPEKLKAFREGREPPVIATHEKVASHYRLPSLDLAQDVWRRIDAGQFGWAKDFRGLHPAPFGHALYARDIAYLFDAAAKAGTAASVSKRQLPPPLDSFNYEAGTLASLSNAECGAGWERVEKWRPSDGARTRPGFVDVPVLVSRAPGAELRFPFRGTAIGIWVLSGPDAGTIDWSVDDGPAHPLDLKTRWSSQLHLPWAMVLDGALPDEAHVLRLRTTDGVARIVHFLVNTPPPSANSTSNAGNQP